MRLPISILAIFAVSIMTVCCEKNPPVDIPDNNEPEEETVFRLESGSRIETAVFASEFHVAIKRNTEFDVEIDSDWIHMMESKAIVRDILDFNVDFNDTRKDRTGKIAFTGTDSGEKITVEVVQRGGLWIDCSLSSSSGKTSWTATDTIGVFGRNFVNQPFVHHEDNWFVADYGAMPENVSAYYPYHHEQTAVISNEEISDYLVAGDSFVFEPVAYILSVNVSDDSCKSCRIISDKTITGPWIFKDGSIEGSSAETVSEIVDNSCSFPVIANMQGNIGMMISHSDGSVSAENYFVDMDGDKTVGHNAAKRYEALDVEENANCYIIDKAGDYCFKLRDAAGGRRWTGEGCSMEIIWSDFAKDFINEPEIIGDMVFFEAAMSKDKQGNAGMALKNSDGKILWSWHLWLTDQTDFRTIEQGRLLNIPLGSITSSRDFQYGDHYHALLYQYGRKDPFPNQSPESDFLAITDEGLNAFDNSGGFGTFYRRDFHQGIFDESCPMVAVETDNGWFSDTPNIKWNTDDWDEVNDPCPPGFSVPYGDVVWKYMTGLDRHYAAGPGLIIEDLPAVEKYNNGLLNIEEDYWFPAVKGRTHLYGVEDQYHPFCGIPSQSFHTWIKRTRTNAGGYYTANAAYWNLEYHMIEIDGWAYGHYMSLVCVKD